MDAHRDDCALEARIGHSGHRQQQLAGQERRMLDHPETMVRGDAPGKP
jgi:hypothetical protein